MSASPSCPCLHVRKRSLDEYHLLNVKYSVSARDGST